MNTPTPTPTPRTDAATYPADCLGTTLVTNRDCARALETELVTLTAAYTCTHHNDAERTACPVCLVTALTAERDELRAALALGQENCDAVYDELRGDCDELCGDVVRLTDRAYRAEAELKRYTDAVDAQPWATDEPIPVLLDRITAELAKERARLERITTALTDAISTYFGADKLVTAERIEAWQAALKEGAK
jgi:hypothetical protein